MSRPFSRFELFEFELQVPEGSLWLRIPNSHLLEYEGSLGMEVSKTDEVDEDLGKGRYNQQSLTCAVQT